MTLATRFRPNVGDVVDVTLYNPQIPASDSTIEERIAHGHIYTTYQSIVVAVTPDYDCHAYMARRCRGPAAVDRAHHHLPEGRVMTLTLYPYADRLTRDLADLWEIASDLPATITGLMALAGLCDAHAAAHQHVIDGLIKRWGAAV